MMTRPLVGKPVLRREDDRLLRGRGRFVDDLEFPGLLHAAIVRSQVAHGVVQGLDRSGLDVQPALLLGPDEIRARAHGEFPVVWRIPGQRQTSYPLYDGRVRYVGQPVGIAVAGDRYHAEDAAERVYLETEDLPVVTDPEAALAADAPLLYPEWGTNVVAELDDGDSAEHTDAVFDEADHVLRTTMRVGRLAGIPMEPRGLVAVPEPGSGRLTVYTTTQAPHMVRDAMARVLGLPEHLFGWSARTWGAGSG